MAVYKDRKRGTWFCVYSFTLNGQSRQKKKRGFATKKDAQDWSAINPKILHQ